MSDKTTIIIKVITAILLYFVPSTAIKQSENIKKMQQQFALLTHEGVSPVHAALHTSDFSRLYQLKPGGIK